MLKDTQTLRIMAESEERELRDRVVREEQVLVEFERELNEVRENEAALKERGEVYDALRRACDAIVELDDLDSAHLFWDKALGPNGADELLAHPRSNIEDYDNECTALGAYREEVIEKINAQNDVLDKLHYELRDAVEVAETRRDEWELEREETVIPFRAKVMPWSRGNEEDKRFHRSLAASILCCALLGWLVSVVDLPFLDRTVIEEVPERVARLVRQDLPPPPPAEPEPQIAEPEPIPEEIPEPELAREEPPEIVEPSPEVIEPPTVAETGAAPQQAEETTEQVRSKGLLAFSDSFASRANRDATARLGSQARISSAGEDAVGRPERMMVSTTAAGSSGGINLADISRDVGGGGGPGMQGVAVSTVTSSIGGGGGGADRPLSSGAAAGRTDEEIQIVFDRHKAALYRAYNRELRRDPTLRGQVVIRLTIEPDGSVSMCQLQSSDMNAPALAQEVVDRVLTFDFGAKEDIVAMTIIYPIDFLPTA